MVEKQDSKVNINDTGALSKEDIDVKSCYSGEQEVTDYWDISGAMELSPGGSNKISGNMKLQNTADQTLATDANQNMTIIQSGDIDKVTMTADDKNAMNNNSYCENGPSAIDKNSLNTNINNNLDINKNNESGVTSAENIVTCCDSRDNYNLKNPSAVVEDSNNNKGTSNGTVHQKEFDTVGTEHAENKQTKNDVSDNVSQNIETSFGAEDNCVSEENKAPMTIREEMMLDAECTEERFRIDRKKLEQMLQAATEGRGQSGEEFFQKIMDDTKTHITWPSKLKIGAKSKKDPHIRICGKPDNIKEARQRIMLSLDTKSNRVTIKMDVSHTEHSHVIGKGGNNIKRVMQETGCHIHFPDSNRNNAGEKSNQVSITGHPEGVENARLKIRNLLPIVLQFEIPNAGMPMPDLNSPMIQHLVQVYGISIQFKQRAKVYSTSCTIRGSSDNIEGLKTGIQTLMSHVSGGQLPVTTQIEIAPQHHAYMLSKAGLNVTTIMQSTGARVIFPDPNALPKKSTVYINGTIESVILARHKLMGCLPLLLMFDMKIDTNNPSNNDTSIIAHLMESLDVSINLKSKPKQPSRTVIIKSIEYNIYNMFESRAKLLGLDTNPVTRPAKSTTPKLSRNATIPQTGPVILLAHSHVPTPTVQTHVISLTEPKSVTPLPQMVLGTPSYVITHTVPSNSATPRPLSAALVHTPSHSPYPTLSTQNNTVSRLVQSPHITKTAQEVSLRNQEEINNSQYAMLNNSMSPPTSVPMPRTVQMQNDAARYQVNVTSPEEMQRRIDQRLRMPPSGNTQSRNFQSENYYLYDHGQGIVNNQNNDSRRSSQNEEYEATMRQRILNMNNNRAQNSENSYEDNRVMLSPSNYDSNLSNNFARNPLHYNGEYPKSGNNMNPISSASPLIVNQNERYADQNLDLQQKMNEHLLRQTAVHYGNNSRMPDQGILHQHLGMQNQLNPVEMNNEVGNPMRIQTSLSSTGSSGSQRQSFGQSIRSPDSVGESRTSLNSDRNSPMSTISDRYNVNSNPKLSAYDQFEEPHPSPSPTNHTANYQSLATRDINSLSPMAHHRSPPQIVLNQIGQFDANHLPENTSDLNEIYSQQNQSKMSTGPPPGFEGYTPAVPTGNLKPDYENLSKLAQKAMVKPVTSEVRTPTDIWAGWGFSKSMPFEMKEELQKLASSKGRYRNNLPTTYENGDEVHDRNQPSPVNEEEEFSLDNSCASRLRVPLPREVPNLGKGSSNLNAWRRRRLINMNLSLGGNMGLNYMSSVQRPPPKNHSAFTPIHPNESLNRSSSSPQNSPANIPEPVSQPRAVVSSPFSKSGNEQTLHVPLPEKPKNYDSRSNMSSTPTIQDSLGLNTTTGTNSKVEADIPDVLNRLGLSKYIAVFQQQEVDYQTFLTLTEPDLKELGISTFGPRKKILLAIKDLNKDRDIFSGPMQNDTAVHENLSDQMLQLQRLQLQQHRDNPQTSTPTHLDTHSLLSSSHQLFNTQAQIQTHLDVSSPALDRGVFQEDTNRGNDRMRSSRLWQNSRTGISNSGRW
uniref:protein bicaudal C homolog 1-like n=1 Tax=Styela clava TaxID=7725 RepID=UPI00193A5833|nr:protein bicaudal C homolog 1-like [Styela clava]